MSERDWWMVGGGPDRHGGPPDLDPAYVAAQEVEPCGRLSPLHYDCSLPAGHPEPHEAWGSVDEHLYDRWTEADAVEEERLVEYLTGLITQSSGWCEPNARTIAEDLAYYLGIRASGNPTRSSGELRRVLRFH